MNTAKMQFNEYDNIISVTFIKNNEKWGYFIEEEKNINELTFEEKIKAYERCFEGAIKLYFS